jgi:hypothetical protein
MLDVCMPVGSCSFVVINVTTFFMYLIFGTFFVEGKTLRLTDDENPVVLTV